MLHKKCHHEKLDISNWRSKLSMRYFRIFISDIWIWVFCSLKFNWSYIYLPACHQKGLVRRVYWWHIIYIYFFSFFCLMSDPFQQFLSWRWEVCKNLKAGTASAWTSQRANRGAGWRSFTAAAVSAGVRLLTLYISEGFNMLILNGEA